MLVSSDKKLRDVIRVRLVDMKDPLMSMPVSRIAIFTRFPGLRFCGSSGKTSCRRRLNHLSA